MARAPATIIGETLHQIRNVDEHGSWNWKRGFEVFGVKWIDFESADRVLEQESAEPEISVWADTSMAWLFNNAAVHGWVVYKSKLRISLRGDLVEEVVAEFESHSKTLQNGETEHQNLTVEIVHSGFEGGHFGVSRARLVREAAVLIAFFMVDSVPFCAVGGVALVYFGV
jgi:hypothetical protein